jgi:hypothetical protein
MFGPGALATSDFVFLDFNSRPAFQPMEAFRVSYALPVISRLPVGRLLVEGIFWRTLTCTSRWKKLPDFRGPTWKEDSIKAWHVHRRIKSTFYGVASHFKFSAVIVL